MSVETGTILHGIDLTVRDGEVVALLGANGSGKSTLVKALTGIVPITAGRAEVFGADVAAARRSVPWSRVGYVPQRMGPSSGVPATAVEVVASGLLDGKRLRPGRGARRKSLEALEQVGLLDRAQDSVQVFSGGQQQRVLIARALAGEPEVLVMDEPTAGVDADSQDLLAGALGHLSQAGGSVVLVAHELGPIAGLIRRAVVLEDGRVVSDGAPPQPEGHHAAPGHAHQHAHGPRDPSDPFGTRQGPA